MAKLYFKFGAMGCSKTAQALITKFNYEERNMKAVLLKPAIDDRDGADIVKSRIGLYERAVAVKEDENLYELYNTRFPDCDAVIVDECQFLTPEQVDQLSFDNDGKRRASAVLRAFDRLHHSSVPRQ